MILSRPFTSLLIASLALNCAPAAGQAAGQNEPQATPSAPDLADLTVSEPLIIDALGITVLLPDRATANVTSIPGGKTTAVIAPPALGIRGPNWVIQVTSERSQDLDLSIDAILDEFEKQRTGRAKADRKKMRIFDRLGETDNLKIAGRTAGRFYCELSTGSGESLMTGYTVFATKPGEFVIVQLDCMSALFDTSRIMYETIAASATFEDPLAKAEGRATALMAGAAFLNSVTNEDLKSLLTDEPQYLRYYRPSATGSPGDDTEVAFQKIQIRNGQAGEVDTTRARASWSVADREFGFLVYIDAQAMQGRATIDTRSVHFLSRDRKSESWAITNTIREGKKTETVGETMIRRGQRMTIKTLREGLLNEERDWSLPEQGYISALERYVLPQLVAMKNPPGTPASFDFAFFFYDSKNTKLTIRRDVFSNIDLPGWRYTSQPERTGPEIETVLDIHGKLLRRTLAGDLLVEPIARERLRRLWRDKGHVMDE